MTPLRGKLSHALYLVDGLVLRDGIRRVFRRICKTAEEFIVELQKVRLEGQAIDADPQPGALYPIEIDVQDAVANELRSSGAKS